MYKICILGAGGVGKSCLTIRFINGNFVDYYDPTIYDCYRKVLKVGNQDYLLEIADTAGQEDYLSLINQYISESQAFVIVFSLDSVSSFDSVHEFYERVKEIKDNPKIVLVGNKCDLEAKVNKKEIDKLCKSWNVPYVESSALEKINIEDIFVTVVEQILQEEKPKPVRKTCNLL